MTGTAITRCSASSCVGRLAFESPGLVGELHRVAAEWLVADGQVFAAIRHAARAQEWQMATELLVDRLGFAELLMGWKGERLRALFIGLPDDAPGTPAALTRAALSLSELDLPRSELHLAAARRLLAEDRSPQSQVRGLAIAVLHAVTASLGADTDAGLRAALVAERAIRLAPTRDLDALVELSAIVSGCKGRVLFERGDLAAGSQVLADGVRTAEAAHLEGAHEELKGMSALVEAVTGRLRRATGLALEVAPGPVTPSRRTETLSRPISFPASRRPPWRWPGSAPTSPSCSWRGAGASGRAAAGVVRLQGARRGAVPAPARLLWSEGDFELALAELQGAGEPMDLGSGSLTAPVTGWLAETLVVGEAASLVALERPAEAIGLLRPLEGGDNIAASWSATRRWPRPGPIRPPAGRPSTRSPRRRWRPRSRD